MCDSAYHSTQYRLAANVRARRKQLGLTQEQAALSMGMATRHLQKLEAGEVNVTLRTLVRIALAFGTDINSLFEVTMPELPTENSNNG